MTRAGRSRACSSWSSRRLASPASLWYFYAPVPPGRRRLPLRALGRLASGRRSGRSATPTRRRAAVPARRARIAAAKPDRLLYLGDVYEARNSRRLSRRTTTWPGVRSREITAPTPGNHDWPRHTLRLRPLLELARYARPKTAAWYAFRAGGWTILSINSQTAHEDRIAAADVGCVPNCAPPVAAGSPSGTGRASAPARTTETTNGVAPIWNALRGRAAIVIAGHEHNMQRLRPDRRDHVVRLGRRRPQSLRGAARRYPRLAFADERTRRRAAAAAAPWLGRVRRSSPPTAACWTAEPSAARPSSLRESRQLRRSRRRPRPRHRTLRTAGAAPAALAEIEAQHDLGAPAVRARGPRSGRLRAPSATARARAPGCRGAGHPDAVVTDADLEAAARRRAR